MALTYDWIFGLAIAFFIAIIMTLIVSVKDGKLNVNGKVFFIFLTIGFAFSTYAGLLNFWIFTLSFIFTIILIYFEIKK